MKNIVKSLCISLFIITPVLGLEVDVNEIKNSKRVQFQNYKGPHNNPDTVNAIYNIGGYLARKSSKAAPGERVTFNYKYSMIHAISKEDKGKYSADIFIIHKNARVDHIRNVRRILAGYYMEKYKYSKQNAMTLALFTTYYNAVHRGEVKYFSEKYKNIVIKNISASNAGIALSYKQWPGKTRIIIPLTEDNVRGTISDINASEIADDKTREEVRKNKDNLDERKDIIEIQKKQIEEDEKRLQEDKKDLEKKKEQVEKEKEEIAEKKKEIEKEKEDAEKIKDPEKREEKEKEIADKEEELKNKEDDVAKQEEDVKEKEKDVEKQEEKIEENKEQVQEEEKEVKRDETRKKIEEGDPDAVNDLEEKEEELNQKEEELERREDEIKENEADDKIVGEKLYYMRIREYLRNGHYNNDMYLIDISTMKIVLKSEVTNIAGSKYVAFSGGVVVITRKEDGYAVHNLTMLDVETLKAKKTGTDNIFWRSFIEIKDGFIYAIVKKDGKYYLGRFDKDLKMVAVSDTDVHEDTFISFYGDYIYINNADKNIIVLKKSDLKFYKSVNGNL